MLLGLKFINLDPAIILVIDVFLGTVHLSRDMSKGGGGEPIYLFILSILKFLDRSIIYSCSQSFEHFLLLFNSIPRYAQDPPNTYLKKKSCLHSDLTADLNR